MTIVLSQCQIISRIGRNLETSIHPLETGQNGGGAALGEDEVGEMALISLSLIG